MQALLERARDEACRRHAPHVAQRLRRPPERRVALRRSQAAREEVRERAVLHRLQDELAALAAPG